VKLLAENMVHPAWWT